MVLFIEDIVFGFDLCIKHEFMLPLLHRQGLF